MFTDLSDPLTGTVLLVEAALFVVALAVVLVPRFVPPPAGLHAA